MKVRALAVAAVVAVTTMLWCAPTYAGDHPVLVDDDYVVELSFDDADAATASVTLINTSEKDLSIVALPTDEAAGCRPETKPVTVSAHTEQGISLKFLGCSRDDKSGAQFTLAEASSPATQLFPRLTATPPTSPKVDWGLLWWFVWAGIIGAVLLAFATLIWAVVQGRNPLHGLPGLDSSWTFKESWASNATVIAAAFTAVLGVTDVATPIFGESDAKKLVTLLAVTTAAALGLAGIAPMLLQTFRTWGDSSVTPLGIFLAGTITLAATGGELAVGVQAAQATKVLKDEEWLVVAGVVGALLLGGYAVSATVQNLLVGGETPPPAPKPKSLKQIVNIVFDQVLRRAAQSPHLSFGKAADGSLLPEGVSAAPPPQDGDFVVAPGEAAGRRRTAIL